MEDIIREIGIISRALDSISNIEFREVELTRGQYLYLVRVCENPGCIQEQIADMLKVDRATTARAIAKLEINGLLLRKSSEENKKNKFIYPTEKGYKIYRFIKRENDYSLSKALTGLNEQQISELNSLLFAVRKNIEAEYDLVKKGKKRLY